MASFNSALFFSLLLAISSFMAALSSVDAQNLFSPSIIRANGTVSCAVNISLSLNDTGLGSLPPFPNAMVELRCGNTTLANTTTNASGSFQLAIRPIQSLLMNFLSLLLGRGQCRVVVTTPLANCNAALPSLGNLAANVTQVVISTVNGVNLIDTVLSVFQFLPI